VHAKPLEEWRATQLERGNWVKKNEIKANDLCTYAWMTKKGRTRWAESNATDYWMARLEKTWDNGIKTLMCDAKPTWSCCGRTGYCACQKGHGMRRNRKGRRSACASMSNRVARKLESSLEHPVKALADEHGAVHKASLMQLTQLLVPSPRRAFSQELVRALAVSRNFCHYK